MKLRASTKQKVEIKEKLKLDRSASNAQAANKRQTVGSSTYYTRRNKKSRKRSKSCWQKKQICRKQLKSQQTTVKTSGNKTSKAEREIEKSKKSWTVPQVMHGGGVEVGPPEMPGVHQPSIFSRKISISTRAPQGQSSTSTK